MFACCFHLPHFILCAVCFSPSQGLGNHRAPRTVCRVPPHLPTPACLPESVAPLSARWPQSEHSPPHMTGSCFTCQNDLCTDRSGPPPLRDGQQSASPFACCHNPWLRRMLPASACPCCFAIRTCNGGSSRAGGICSKVDLHYHVAEQTGGYEAAGRAWPLLAPE